MRRTNRFSYNLNGSWFVFMLVTMILINLLLMARIVMAVDVSYYIYGRAYGVHTSYDSIEGDSILAIPGVKLMDSELADANSPPVPLPGITIEAYNVLTKALLGTGRANRDGYYNIHYMAPEANHKVRFLVFLDFADGKRESVGVVNETLTGAPVEVNNRLFHFPLYVPTEHAIKAGTPMFSSIGEFVFTEVGDIDVDDIYDEQRDSNFPTKWGLTKPTATAGFLPSVRSLGPEFAFGGTLELYGLFGNTSGARYYKINYTGTQTGTIQSQLYKKNYVIVGTGIEVYRVLMGPKTVTIGSSVTLTDVYELDERLVGEHIVEDPNRIHSPYWTELGLRGVWNTRIVAAGDYTLSVTAWDASGTLLPAATNNFANINLRIVNTPPNSSIHNIQHLDGNIVLDSSAPCQSVILDKTTPSVYDDSLRFEITADHPTSSDFFLSYDLSAWYGHDTSVGPIISETLPRTNYIVETPAGITYQSCAYRFRLRVWPKITNGYYIIYIRDDNWYASIHIKE